MARRQTRRSVPVDLANSSKHVKGETGVNSEKYKGVLTSSGGVARPRPLCGLGCAGEALWMTRQTFLTSRPHSYRGLTKHHPLLGDSYSCCPQVTSLGASSTWPYIPVKLHFAKSQPAAWNSAKLTILLDGTLHLMTRSHHVYAYVTHPYLRLHVAPEELMQSDSTQTM
jgi:hypothetical protein